MKKIASWFFAFILWIVSILMFILGFAYLPSLGGFFMLLAGILSMPIKPIKFLRQKIFRKKAISVLVVFLLVLAGLIAAPEAPASGENPGQNTQAQVTTDEITDIPSTESPATEPPATEPPPTQPPVTEPPVTEPPATEPPATEPPVTETPATEPPETEPPVIVTPVVPQNSTFSIHFIDVGQADAALVECDGQYMLIDGGNKADSNVIYSVLKNRNVPKLHKVVATHAHEDHVGGLSGAYNFARVDITLFPVKDFDSDVFASFKKYVESAGGGITVPSVGDKYTLGSAVIEILGVNSTPETNNTSIVLMITYGETRFLFTGDAEREAEQVILDSGVDLSATLLKVGHHGSENSTTYPFLREIMPEYAVISVGEGNNYGHPTDAALSRLRDADVKVYRTDMQGDIFCVSDGKTVTVTVESNPDGDMFVGADVINPPTTEPPVTEPPVTEPPVSGTEYVLNTNSKKFHYPSCSSAKKIKDENIAYHTGTREELIAMGYDPCGNCDP